LLDPVTLEQIVDVMDQQSHMFTDFCTNEEYGHIPIDVRVKLCTKFEDRYFKKHEDDYIREFMRFAPVYYNKNMDTFKRYTRLYCRSKDDIR